MKLFFGIILPVVCAVLLCAGLTIFVIRRPKRSARLLVIALAAAVIYCIIGSIYYTK
ncbi:MAG: hypothetical protein IKP42_08640 [Ruminococcus sp.]|nr:hypothetical protein [Ruminococcus sp.]